MKTYLRKSIDQEKLTNLVLLNFESKTYMEMDFDNVIKNFVLIKAKNVDILCSNFWCHFE